MSNSTPDSVPIPGTDDPTVSAERHPTGVTLVETQPDGGAVHAYETEVAALAEALHAAETASPGTRWAVSDPVPGHQSAFVDVEVPRLVVVRNEDAVSVSTTVDGSPISTVTIPASASALAAGAVACLSALG